MIPFERDLTVQILRNLGVKILLKLHYVLNILLMAILARVWVIVRFGYPMRYQYLKPEFATPFHSASSPHAIQRERKRCLLPDHVQSLSLYSLFTYWDQIWVYLFVSYNLNKYRLYVVSSSDNMRLSLKITPPTRNQIK